MRVNLAILINRVKRALQSRSGKVVFRLHLHLLPGEGSIARIRPPRWYPFCAAFSLGRQDRVFLIVLQLHHRQKQARRIRLPWRASR